MTKRDMQKGSGYKLNSYQYRMCVQGFWKYTLGVIDGDPVTYQRPCTIFK